MTATNHMLAGAIIGAFLPLPLAIPLAFASHFVLDALPHFGVDEKKRDQHFMFKAAITVDTILAVLLGLSLIHFDKWGMLAGAAAAFSPDIIWLYKYVRQGKTFDMKHGNRFTMFHANIQQWERPWGIFVEIGAFALMLPTFLTQLLKT